MGDLNYDAVIIGAGACGLMCAVQAGFLGKRTLILEKNDKAGAKILISGGGRCNYTNLHCDTENFISQNPHFIKSSMAAWTVEDSIQFFETYGIVGQEKTLGQLFPESNTAKDVVAVFVDLCKQMEQEIFLNATVTGINKTEETYSINYHHNGQNLSVATKNLVIATGGLPIPKMGATDFGLKIAKQFGLKITETTPALVPLTITGKDLDWFAHLSGNSIFAQVSNERISFEENILFTHWGLSGPAILQISSYLKPGESIHINLLPNKQIKTLIENERGTNGKKLFSNFLTLFYTRKFVDALGDMLPLEKNLASLTKDDLEKIEKTIHHFTIKPAGNKGYDKAEVMKGGVCTDELSSKTLESKKNKGLYFGGECVDVTGWLGGYNFQWAWASGFVIAQHIRL